MQYYAGIDLHSSNNFLGIIDENNNRHFGKRLNNDIELISQALAPYRENIVSVTVESTYNWYWLVDALLKNGYPVHLANPCAIKQYSGLKYTDDKTDAFWLANMKRLNILAEGYIYPKEERALRDLARRRVMYVQQRTAQILSLESMFARNCGILISGEAIKKLKEEDVTTYFNEPYAARAARDCLRTICFLNGIIKDMEKDIAAEIRMRDEYKMLCTVPGIGTIIALTIKLEVGDIRRFKTVGDYSSYCRCVGSVKMSNDKKKGKNNKKNGNRYLAWAYMEAANYMIRYNEKAKKFYERKKSRSNRVLALKALSNKIARATYYMMRDQIPFVEDKLFS